MNNEIVTLTPSDIRLFMHAAIDMRLSELEDLIVTSIQHGPVISLSGRLHRIEKEAIPPLCWSALMEFVEWGAGIVAHNTESQCSYLLADAAHVERMLRLIAKRFDSDSGETESQVVLNRPDQVPLVKPLRKREDSPELG
ncbi:hypothetical protein [Pseudomonas sp. PS02288]|uniref:hypothetical protein n=1 Tax=Pseudomonas sp. PS02288 TaxID=2991443 RepID=UPI00249A0230|nr:hypothetical protein [Pseudomonas sp. PS02288]